nr:hypothetical protein [Tanacetum cinerariifolium]
TKARVFAGKEWGNDCRSGRMEQEVGRGKSFGLSNPCSSSRVLPKSGSFSGCFNRSWRNWFSSCSGM